MKFQGFMISALAVSSLLMTSCRHKDLCFDHSHRAEIQVVFDWRNAPDANPTSMLTYFFPGDGEKALLYTFADRNGGVISLPLGRYVAIGINGDNTDWAGMRNTDDPESFEVYTKDAINTAGYGLPSYSLPRARGSEEERMALTPGMMWSDRQESDVEFFTDDNDKIIKFYPEETVCHYTVDVMDVKNMEYLHGSTVDANISGMAEGFLHGKRTTTDVSVTMPFTFSPENTTNSLHSEFLTFGECANVSRKHMLTVYLILTDGTKWYHSFDVTDQVKNAKDPHHVHIVVSGLDLPKPISGGGGFKPNVNGWNEIEIDLKM